MVLDTPLIMEVIYQVAEEKELKATVRSSLAGGAVTGGAATLGGMLMGPIGLAVGGAIGGLLSSWYLQGEFQSVVTVLREMDPQQQQILAQKVQRVMEQLGPEDLVQLSVLALSSNLNVQNLIVREVTSHLSNTLSMNVLC